MSTLIKGGTVATSTDVFVGDVYVENGIITEMGEHIEKAADQVIVAAGKYVIPGGIDVHTHLNIHVGDTVAADDFYTGTVAAACGGTTTIVDHMGFGPKGCALKHQVDVYHEYAGNKAVIDYGFHGVVQHIDEDILQEMETLVTEEGITSFKVYLTYNYKLRDEDVLKAMKRLGELGAITAIHCENDDILSYFKKEYVDRHLTSPIYHALSRPEEAEEEAVNRMITLSSLVGNAPIYIVHVSTAKAANVIAKAKERKLNVFGETCPQYLLLEQTLYGTENNEGLKYIMSPPLREKHNQELLWKSIEDGTMDVVGTDHCPFNFAIEKQKGKDDFTKCPNGIPGIETRVPLMFSEGFMKGRISLNKYVQIMSTNPAKIMGLYPKKGDIKIGSDADIVIMDPTKKLNIQKSILHENVDYTCYENFPVQAYPILTMSRGEIIVKDGKFIGQQGRGQYMKRVTGGQSI